MSNSADNYFSCSETPANFPTGLKLVDVPESSTSKLRIISKIPGPGNYSGPIDFFYDVNENKTYGSFISSKGDHKTVYCNVLDKSCNSKEEWDKLVKPYMEE